MCEANGISNDIEKDEGLVSVRDVLAQKKCSSTPGSARMCAQDEARCAALSAPPACFEERALQ